VIDAENVYVFFPDFGLRQEQVRRQSENYYASAVAADGKVYLASRHGVVSVIRANPLNEEIFATPAFAEGRLSVRTVSALYCFGTR